jgi:maltose/moltooligosaccharide transporter
MATVSATAGDGWAKPRLSLGRILQMNLGFLGLQFSFGLQQSNMGPIYGFLGASEAAMPLLWLAGPMTGLIVQPVIGAMSDRTVTRWGRRTPYFVVGAVLCSLCLLAMPFSRALWIAVSLLWVLDAANNVTMEPYRAYVRDRLDERQQTLGFLTQASFTGAAQTLSYLAPSVMVWMGVSRDALAANGIPVFTHIAFVVGAVLSIATILWSVLRVRELPLPPDEAERLAARPRGPGAVLAEVGRAIAAMPRPMRQMAPMKLFQWYAMFTYWQFIVFALSRSLFGTSDPQAAAFRDATLINGQVGAFYNLVACVAGFAMIPLARRIGSKWVHAACVAASGVAMLVLPHLESRELLFLPMLGIGIGWASMMGNPYVMLARAVPAERTGVYMGIFNMFIVLPMLLQTVTVPLFYEPLLGGDPRKAIMLAGALMLAAAAATLLVQVPEREPADRPA